ncbi:MAG: resuscitation-promoting factor RpfE [Thermoleophilaceae bacterium]|jgi:hypothetical protein|nr:resuscitation-promoting factor RpfE [Thermoleophilaceae bacterium]
MRRLMVPALCAGAIAAPIPVALAAGPEIGHHVAATLAEGHLEKYELRDEARAAKRAAKRRAAERRAVAAVPVPPQLESIALCESGGDPTIVSSNGMYHGKYQFSVATWAAMGGSGLPSQAPEAEQDMRAAMLYASSGPGQWPVCGG